MPTSTTPQPSAPPLPFPISRISQRIERYFLYTASTITWLRQQHNILGVLIGTLAQIPQQNVFLGIPLELQPEEARLLVEKGVAYIVDDHAWHTQSYTSMTREEKEAYKNNLRREGQKLARASVDAAKKRSELALRRRQPTTTENENSASVADQGEGQDEDDALFSTPQPSPSPSAYKPTDITPYSITPSTSQHLLPTPPSTPPYSLPLPTVNPASYALFAHLHNAGYFLSPGLRFGCQFLVYPGDPLRFHSHFLAVSAEWDEEIDLLDLVGGGRLGTGVKKGWMIGGPVSRSDEGGDGDEDVGQGGSDGRSEVRTFCIEWGGM